MKPYQQKSLMLASSLAMVLALAACDRNRDGVVGDRAVDRTEQSTTVTEESRDAAARARAEADRAAEETRSMGAATGDRLDDATITARVNAQLAADQDLSAIRIDVDTKDGVVTLTGPAPSAAARERASEIAKSVQGVTSVNNQLSVQAG
jgi:hyperosmotically inducible periplasmic protein